MSLWTDLLEQEILNAEQKAMFNDWINEAKDAKCCSFQLDIERCENSLSWEKFTDVKYIFSCGEKESRILFEHRGKPNETVSGPFNIGHVQTYAQQCGYVTLLKREVVKTSGEKQVKIILIVSLPSVHSIPSI